MSDEHESAVAAWLDSPETLRELAILRDRFPEWTEFQRTQIALSMEILAALNVYEGEPDITIEINKPAEDEIDEADRWKYIDPDQLGSP
jgi:hypothetical protein